jgi:1-acyl-sn-glycerol-3-phosphate acyltransferase
MARRKWPRGRAGAVALGRGARLFAHLLRGFYQLQTAFPRLDEAARAALIQHWSARCLGILGVTLREAGKPAPAGPLLVVANHISWLDILVINAVLPCRFIAKGEVRHWPLLGRLVAGAGTVFIERARKRDALRVVHEVAQHLRAGERLAVFPEGTTSDGRDVLPFHANLLQAAVVTDTPVQPVGLAYRPCPAGPDTAERHQAPVYVGEMSFVHSLWRVLTACDLCADLRWGTPQTAAGRDRRVWAEALRQEVRALAAITINDR